MAAGGLIGCFPVVVYELLSRGGTLTFMRNARLDLDLLGLLQARAPMLIDALLCDRECRAAWDGPASSPLWLSAILGAGVLFGLVTALLRKDDTTTARWHRLAALFCLVLAGIMTFSRLPVGHHHLINLVPAAAVVVVLGFTWWATCSRVGQVAGVAFGLFYFCAAMWWNVSMIRGFERTGGTGAWSDAIYFVNDYLETHQHGREVKILDWGLHNNLFVLSSGDIRAEELFWGADADNVSAGKPWPEHLSPGDLYLTNAEGKRHFPKATSGFERALAESGLSFQRARFHTRTGGPYAELISVLPADVGRPSPFVLPQPEGAAANRIEVGEIERSGTK